MHNVTETNTLVHLAGGKTIISKAKGKIRFNDHELDCVYLPEGENNIISINQLHALNYGVFSTTGHIVLLKLHTIPKELVKDFMNYLINKVELKSSDVVFMSTDNDTDDLPYVEIKKTSPIKELSTESANINQVLVSDKVEILVETVLKLTIDDEKLDTSLEKVPENDIFRAHCALGHMHYRSMRKLGLNLTPADITAISRCKACKVWKFKNKPTTCNKDHTSTKPFEQLHMDTTGPHVIFGIKYYVVLLIDDFTRYLKVFIVRSKSDIVEAVGEYIDNEQSVRGYYPRFITTDKGSEFSGLGFEITKHWDYQPMGLRKVPYLNVAPTGNKQYNGLAERTVQTLKLIQTLIVSHLHPYYREKYFKESFELAAQIYNRTPHSGIGQEFPFGKYFNRKAKSLTDDERKDKDLYLSSQPAHMFLNIQRTLPELPMFLEDGFYPKEVKGKTSLYECFFVGYDENDCTLVMYKNNVRKTFTIDKTTQFVRLGSFHIHKGEPTDKVGEVYSSFVSSVPFSSSEEKFLKERVTPKIVEGVETINITKLKQLGSVITKAPALVPRNFKEAMNLQEWVEAIEKEVNSFLKLGVYSAVKERLMDAKCLHTFWLFTRKITGEAKARLITIDPKMANVRDKGCSSPVARQLSLFIMFLQFTLENDLYFTVYDVKTAFLHAVVDDDENYILRTPLGFGLHFKTKFVRMNKYCYGLPISPLKFHQKLSTVLEKNGRQQSVSDVCLHISLKDNMIISHHVDDILVLSSNPQLLENDLVKAFTNITISREPEFFLGFDFHQNAGSLTLGLSTYLEKSVSKLPSPIQKIIKTHSLKPFIPEGFSPRLPEPTAEVLIPRVKKAEDEDARHPDENLASTVYDLGPLQSEEIDNNSEVLHLAVQQVTKSTSSNSTNNIHSCDSLFTHEFYRQLTGILTYLAHKGRCDIMVYTNILSQFNSKPTVTLFRQAVHLLQYAYSTRYTVYKYFKFEKNHSQSPTNIPNNYTKVNNSVNSFTKKLQMDVYTDASDKSGTVQCGYLILINGFFIDAKSFRSSFHAKCSYYAEAVSLRRGVEQARVIVSSLKDFGYTQDVIDIRVHCDNKSVVNMVIQPDQMDKKQKLDLIYRNCFAYLDYHYKIGCFQLFHISGDINPADMLTKPLPYQKLFALLRGPILKKTVILNTGPKSPKQSSSQ